MDDQDKILLIETDQRSKSNSHRLDALESELKEVRADQKIIYKLASSVEVLAEQTKSLSEKVDETNKKVDEQRDAWHETERKLFDRANEVENKPYRKTADNINSIRVSIITAVCTLIITGIIGVVITFVK